MLHRRLVHQQNVGDQRLGDFGGEPAGLLDRDALGDGLGGRILGQRFAPHRLAHRRIERGLGAINGDVRLDALGRHRHARDQSASAHRHHQRVQAGHIFQHFQRQSALAGDDFGVVVGMDESEAFAIGDGAGGGPGFLQVIAFQHHPGAEIAGVLDLGEGGGFRHHDGGGNAQPAGMIGHALGVIAGAHGGDAALFLVRRQRLEAVERAALFERRGELPVFEFEMDLATRDLGQGARMAHRRALNLAGDHLCRGADIVKRYGKRCHARLLRKPGSTGQI